MTQTATCQRRRRDCNSNTAQLRGALTAYRRAFRDCGKGFSALSKDEQLERAYRLDQARSELWQASDLAATAEVCPSLLAKAHRALNL